MLEEMLSAQATIKAAELQAEATMWAAAIGGVAIVFGLIFSWRTALHLQRVARLAETRKNVYLELAEAYSNMIKEFNLILLDVNGKWPSLLESIVELSKKVDKTLFICETKNKDVIISFLGLVMDTYESFGHKIAEIRKLAEDFKDLSSHNMKILERFEDAANYLQKIKIENPDPQKIEIILNYFNEQVEEGEKHTPLINQKAKELNDKINKFQPCIHEIIHSLNERVLSVNHVLRDELGAKNDVALDIHIYAKYKNKRE